MAEEGGAGAHGARGVEWAAGPRLVSVRELQEWRRQRSPKGPRHGVPGGRVELVNASKLFKSKIHLST